MVLLRRVIGDALRARRQGQHRTLREVSTAANVSLGYLSEIERGQKEASSELLAAICEALGAQLSDLLREVSDTVAVAEQIPDVLVPAASVPAVPAASVPAVPAAPADAVSAAGRPAPADAVARRAHATQDTGPDLPAKSAAAKAVQSITDGKVSVSVRQDSPLKATLHVRTLRPVDRDVVRLN